jgi:predicted ATP-grasp superfamily ATP-dependent carboligase
MTRVENLEQMLAAYQEAADAGLETMLQELIPGNDADGVNYNSYFWDGEPLIEFTAEKVRNAPPGLGSPRVAVSKHIHEVLEPGRKILQAMGFYGYACTEFKKDARNGVYKLMEVNGRHNLSTLLAVRCGINFPWLHYKHLIEGELPASREYEKNIYWIDLPREILFGARYFTTEHYSFTQYIRPYLKPHVFAIFDRNDPKPFIKRWVDLLKKAVKEILVVLQLQPRHKVKSGGEPHERRRYSH